MAAPPLAAQEAEEVAEVAEVAEDPYVPIGMRAGSFVLFPSIDALAGYTDNAGQTAQEPESSSFFTLAPELLVRSNWSRHSLNLDLRGSYTTFNDTDDEDLYGEARANAGIEIGSRTVVNLLAGATVSEEDDITDRSYVVGASLTHRFNRLSATLRGQLEDFDFEDRDTSLGSVAEDDVADYEEHEAGLRLSYVVTDRLSLFTDGSVNERIFDRSVDASGTLRGSQGYEVRAGAAFAPTGKVSGEVSAGYLEQDPDDPTFDDITAFVFDASLRWRPTELTVVNLNVSTDVGETTLAGSSGYVGRQADLGVQHSIRRNVILRAGASYRLAEFEGADLDEQTIELTAGADYLLNRNVALTAGVSREWFDSTATGSDYEATTVFAGIRLRR